MLEYEMADSGISQVLSQDGVDRAALFRREGFVFAKLVHGVLSLCLRKLICQNILSQCSEGSREFSMLCSSAVRFSMLCSSAVRFSVLSGSADRFSMASNSSAPIAKPLLFSSASFVARHNTLHSLV